MLVTWYGANWGVGYLSWYALFSKIVTTSSFDFIVSNVRNKLNGWKARKLPLAVRITLAKSVLLAIPNYLWAQFVFWFLFAVKLKRLFVISFGAQLWSEGDRLLSHGLTVADRLNSEGRESEAWLFRTRFSCWNWGSRF